MARESILIVDKDGELARILGLFLNLQGFRINHTSRARDALTKMNLQKYAAVIVDPDLGEGGDEVLCATLESGSLNAATPFILVSGSDHYEVPNQCLSKIKAVVRKPFEFEDLLGALQLARASQDLAAAS